MTVIVRITCEKDTSRLTTPDGPPCPYADLDIDIGYALDLQIYDQLKPQGWSFNGEQQFCPRHNPDLTGLPIALGQEYIEPVPGVRIRLGRYEGERVRAELLLDKNHYDVDNPGSGTVWRAKHVSEEWTT